MSESEGQMKVPKRSASLSSGRLMSSSQESFCRVVVGVSDVLGTCTQMDSVAFYQPSKRRQVARNYIRQALTCQCARNSAQDCWRQGP